ncbi:MAG: PadR family transcriptional regulator [Gemmatimonadota bacterium]|nr:PadR family transcriptional regulator [Gemmatimonadota bacterium]
MPDLDLLQGTLDFLILRTLAWGPMHGFGVARWIRGVTDGTLQIDDGALYPALHRMEHRGWILADWGITENNRRAKFYRLSAKGRKQLQAQTATWQRYASAVTQVIRASGAARQAADTP